MLKVEIFYNSTVDNDTPAKADEIRAKYKGKVDVYLLDISEHTAPEKYGIINAPSVVIDEKQIYKLEGPDSLTGIVKNVIF